MRWSDGKTPVGAMRGLALVAAASATLKLGSLAFAWNTTAVAAQPAATRADAACGADGRSFRELLESVRAKADELQRRESALRTRENGLAATRRIVGAEVTRLEGIAKALGVTAGGSGGAGEGMSIGKVFEAMPPEEAAPILDRLDDVTLRAVLGRMRERQVAAILTAMSPERAVAVTKAFASPDGPAGR
jgi:flagellar motility protein MotE (MotC chaperone)